MDVVIVEGDLLDQKTESIVNAWNRNIIPWWLLIPCGVSGAIKKHGGIKPFCELGKMGPIPVGHAVITSSGKLPYKCIVHVASINMFWCANRDSIYNSVISAMKLAEHSGLNSIAFPILGAGSGGFNAKQAESIMLEAFHKLDSPIKVVLVRYKRR